MPFSATLGRKKVCLSYRLQVITVPNKYCSIRYTPSCIKRAADRTHKLQVLPCDYSVRYTAGHCVHRVLGRPFIMRGRGSSVLRVSLEVISDRPVTSPAASSPFAKNHENINQSLSLVVIEPSSNKSG